MPKDSELTELDTTAFGSALRAIEASPEPRAIPLLLGSFGEWGGFGQYQRVEDVISKFDRRKSCRTSAGICQARIQAFDTADFKSR